LASISKSLVIASICESFARNKETSTELEFLQVIPSLCSTKINNMER
jgi:hypothetical protein